MFMVRMACCNSFLFMMSLSAERNPILGSAGSSPDYEDTVRRQLADLEEEAMALGRLARTAMDGSPVLRAIHEGITECMNARIVITREFGEPTRWRLLHESLG